jgi:hypothetical protein
MINNQKQVKFNEIKGVLSEITFDEQFCSITIQVGHTNPRQINLSSKKVYFDEIIKDFKVGDNVLAMFYIASTKKYNRWYTTAFLLSLNRND